MLKKLLTQTLSYGMSTVIARLINYLIVPLHTGYFKTEDYGTVSLFYSYIIILNSLYTYGMETAYFRISVHNSQAQRTAQSLLLASTTLLTLLGLWWQNERLWSYMLFILALDTLCVIPFAQLRLKNKVYLFSGLKILNAVIIFGLNLVYFYFGFAKGLFQAIDWVLVANLAGSGIIFLILLPSTTKAGFGINLPMAYQMLSYGWPFLFGGLFFAVNEAGDRLMLELFASGNPKEQIGIYSACYKLSIFITLAVQAYKFAAEPLFFSAWGQKELYSRSMTLFVAVCCAMMLLVSANSFWIAHILIPNSAYHSGLGIVPYLLLANIFLGMYYNFSVWYKLSDKTYYAAWIGFLGALITVALNYILIPHWGYWGSTWATLVCYFSMAWLCYFYGKKHYYINYQINRIVIYLFLAFIFSIIAQYIKIWGNLLLVLFVIFVWVLERKELKLIK